jgi:hypothetical protein
MDGLAECAVQDVGEQSWQVGREELVGAGGEFGVGPPAVPDEAGFLVRGVLRLQGRCGVGDAGKIDTLAPVVLAAPVAEASLTAR